MTKMTGGQALAKSLYREGVRVVFGLPGAGQYEAIDGIYEEPGIRYFTTRHEQATTHMADGFARVSGNIATALVIPGAGVFNASTGIATAHSVSSPILVVTGRHDQSPSAEMPSIRQITKWAARATNPADVPAIVHEAFYHLKTGRPRPVYLEVPHEVLAAEAEVKLLEPESYDPPAGDPECIAQAAHLLAAAQRPAIWAGTGVQRSGASQALQALAEHLQAPVVTGRESKGVISDHHPLSLGMGELRFDPLRKWLTQRDVVLAVGTSRFGEGDDKQQIIRIDIDETAIERTAHHCVGILGDARCCLEAIYRIVSSTTPARPNCGGEVHAINAARFDPKIQLQPQWGFMQAIRAAIPDDGIFIQGMNQIGYYSRNYYPVYEPRSYLISAGNLGVAFPVALGAKIAKPDKAVVVASGDGGFLYNSQELATAVQYGINVVVIVFNDNAYGNVLRAQIEQFDGHVLGTELYNPDFVKLAEAYGVGGVRVHDAGQLESALREALAADAPRVIEVPVGRLDREY
jgi:acetolactate synthase-1/2/3 large subunit